MPGRPICRRSYNNTPGQAMHNTSEALIRFAALSAAAGAAIHLAAIIGGPSWYAYFGAPAQIVASAREGTWLAPVSAAGIAFLMGICSAYACSAIGVIGRLPLLRTMLAGMATICLLRALMLFPFAYLHPHLVTIFEIVASLIWGIAGLGFAAGLIRSRSTTAARPKPYLPPA